MLGKLSSNNTEKYKDEKGITKMKTKKTKKEYRRETNSQITEKKWKQWYLKRAAEGATERIDSV